MNDDVRTYNGSQSGEDKAICEFLSRNIGDHLTDAESKVWHGHPVWFLNGNPIVGYARLKDCVQLLFWSGQSFDEKKLTPNGNFKAAEVRYTQTGQVDTTDLQRWLEKAIEIQWDYKNITKRRGALERLK